MILGPNPFHIKLGASALPEANLFGSENAKASPAQLFFIQRFSFLK